MAYLSYLPVDKSAFFAPVYNALLKGEEYSPEYNDTSNSPPKGWWKKELDRRRGRNRPRDTITIEQFMKDMNSK